MGQSNSHSYPRLLCQTWGLAVCGAPGSREGKVPKEKPGVTGFLTTGFPVPAPPTGLSQALRTDCQCTQHFPHIFLTFVKTQIRPYGKCSLDWVVSSVTHAHHITMNTEKPSMLMMSV